MGPSKVGTRIRIVSSSGILRVTIPPKRSWPLIFLEITMFFLVLIWVYSSWTKISTLFRAVLIWGFASAALALIYQLSVTQIVEFDSQRMTLYREIHGWERRKEYRIEECSELEWSEGSEGEREALKCKVGCRKVQVCQDVSETESIEILTALQRNLPEVAQRVCSYPGFKEHYLTLGLDKKK